jgi:redox-sensitive bicupin YhaK (pirin superfamily)
MSDDPILGLGPLGFPWETPDPFLFCVHHDDAYPEGDERMAPRASMAGRNLGQDFTVKDGFRMYHGRVVPGFPSHPHRGFETVTIARRGYIDHSDSLGATARFGQGDVQWMTAGKGIVHAEMFPLVHADAPNPVELFQIWLNLPARDKLVEPHFTMLWDQVIPRHEAVDEQGKKTVVTVVAGQLGDAKGPPPPPKSWAARPESDVAIWTLKLDPGARFTLPKAGPRSNRMLYFFRGASMNAGGHALSSHVAMELAPGREIPLVAGPEGAELLLLQGRPIGEPVAAHGPFVMNSRAEIMQAFSDYQRTRFGGWPWADDAPVHPRDAGRFAKHADGRVEKSPR